MFTIHETLQKVTMTAYGEAPHPSAEIPASTERPWSAQCEQKPELTGKQPVESGSAYVHDPDNPDFSNADWCRAEMARLYKLVGSAGDQNDRMKVVAQLKAVPDLYEQTTGEKLHESRVDNRSLSDILTDGKILELNREQVDAAERSVKEALTDKDPEQLKKKRAWLLIIERLRAVQDKARASAVGAWAYYGANEQGVWPVQTAPLHKKFFKALGHKGPGVIIMAPPRHGKSLALTGYLLYRIQENPSIRILVMFADNDQCRKQIMRLKRHITKNGKYRALFPHVEILGRMDNVQDSQGQFTVRRENYGGREPTVEGKSIDSNVQGNGYDLIFADDINTEDVITQEDERNRINHLWFNTIERRVDVDTLTGNVGEIKYVCTPWHDEDTAGKIISAAQDGQRSDWKVCKLPVLDDENGKAISLWPEHFGTAYYERLKADPHVDYDRLFRLETRPKEERIVKKIHCYPSDCDPNLSLMGDEAVKRTMELHKAFDTATNWLSIDPSATARKTSTLTAASQISVIGDKAYVRKAWFFPGDPVVLRKWIITQIAGQTLIDERYVEPDDDDATRGAKLRASSSQVPARGKITYILLDANGPQRLGTTLLGADIYSKLKEMGVLWPGSVIERRSNVSEGGQNAGKESRLRATASLIVQGFISFPGRYVPNCEGLKNPCKLEVGPDADIKRLVNQITNFPVGTSDGVDTITQFLIQNYHNLGQTPIAVPQAVSDTNTLREGMRKKLEEMRKPPQNTQRDEEVEWLSQMSMVA